MNDQHNDTKQDAGVELATDGVTIWHQVARTIKDTMREANLSFSPSGLSIEALDQAGVCFTSTALSLKAFSHWQIHDIFTEENPLRRGLEVDNLTVQLSVAGKKDRVKMWATQHADSIPLEFQAPTAQSVGKGTIKLIDIPTEKDDSVFAAQTRKWNHPITVQIPSATFRTFVNGCYKISNHITITVNKQGCTIAASDVAKGGMSRTWHCAGPVPPVDKVIQTMIEAKRSRRPKYSSSSTATAASTTIESDDTEVEAKAQEAVLSEYDNGGIYIDHSGMTFDGRFALQYVVNFIKSASTLAPVMYIRLGPDIPCVFEYMFWDLDNGAVVGRTRYYLGKMNDVEEEPDPVAAPQTTETGIAPTPAAATAGPATQAQAPAVPPHPAARVAGATDSKHTTPRLLPTPRRALPASVANPNGSAPAPPPRPVAARPASARPVVTAPSTGPSVPNAARPATPLAPVVGRLTMAPSARSNGVGPPPVRAPETKSSAAVLRPSVPPKTTSNTPIAQAATITTPHPTQTPAGKRSAAVALPVSASSLVPKRVRPNSDS